MTVNELKIEQNKIRTALGEMNVLEAVTLVEPLVEQAGDYALRQELDRVATEYRFMLRFLADGATDPGREKVLSHAITALYDITDRCIARLFATMSYDLFYTRRSINSASLSELLTGFRQDLNKIDMLKAADGNDEVVDKLKQQLENLEIAIFNAVWTAFPLTADDETLLRDAIADDNLPHPTRCLILSALLLGITKYFDRRKLMLFCDAYEMWADTDTDLAARAVVAIALTLFIYRNRLRWNDDVRLRLESMAQLTHWQSDLRLACMRLTRSRNTDNITRRMNQEIIPDIKKLGPDMLKNLKKGKDAADTFFELEENPDWKDWLEETGIQEKMQELNDMQLEGDDVHMYISTFAHLKSHPFFNTLANWFMPFHDRHSSVTKYSESQHLAIVRMLHQLPIICNSDKYSIFFSLVMMPQQQQTMLASMYQQQVDALREMDNTEALPAMKQRDYAVNMYIKDLYRFFKLFSRKNEFYQVFNSDFSVISTPHIKDVINDTPTLATIAEFYFKNEFYNDAIDIYEHLLAHDRDADSRYYQKIGFAWQCLGDYTEALKAYKKYELVNERDPWNLRHIAACYRAQGQLDLAIDYYRRALEQKPDSVPLMLNLAKTTLDNGDPAQALKLYFKIDFIDDKRHRAWRPIAWCSLVTANYEQSEKYYRKIIEQDQPSAADRMNYGHLLLITGRLKEAVKQYRLSLEALDGDHRRFRDMMNNDSPTLAAAGVPRTLIALATPAAERPEE